MILHQFKSLIRFYWKAGTIYNVHSDFLYQFLTTAMDLKKTYYAYPQIELIRSKLLKNDRVISIEDLGAGSHKMSTHDRKISKIASVSVSDLVSCRILFQIVEYFKCKNILELGTSLGISSLYLASSSNDIRVTTIEGDVSIANIARDVHAEAHADNIQIIHGTFEKVLPQYLKNSAKIDLAFIDGHHDEKATLDYFNQILNHCHNESIIILDDIYWSEGMTQAWMQIARHPKVTLALDLYIMGIVFLKPDLSKQYITYIPYRFKPWKIGLIG